MLRPVLALIVLVATVAARRRSSAQRAERDLWAEAGVAPDLR